MEINKLKNDRVAEARVDNAGLAKTAAAKSSKEVKGVEPDLFSISGVDPSESEKVNWSSDAQIATEAMRLAKASSDVRTDRVKELKESIRSGAYKVDAQAVADKMLESSLIDGVLAAKL